MDPQGTILRIRHTVVRHAAGWLLPILAVLPLFATTTLLGVRSPVQSVDMAAVILGAAGVVAAALALTCPVNPLSSGRLIVPWFLLVLWAGVSAGSSGRSWAAFVGEPMNMAGWAAAVAISLVTVAVAARPGGARRALFLAAPIVVLVETGFVAYQYAQKAILSGTLPNSTYLGQVIVLLLPWVVPVGIQLKRWEWVARSVVALVAITVLAGTGARVAVLVAIAWAGWVIWRALPWRRAVKAVATAAVAAVAVIAAFIFARAELMTTIGEGALGLRPLMLKTAWRAALSRPVLGFGPDGFTAGSVGTGTVQVAARNELLLYGAGNADPHNFLANVLVSIGFVGLALLLWLSVEVALHWWRGRTSASRLVAVWSVLGCAVVMLTAPVPAHAMPLFGVCLGLSLVPVWQSVGATHPAPRFPAWPPRAALVLLGVASLFFALDAASRFPFEVPDPAVSPKVARGADSVARTWSIDPYLAYLSSLHLGYAAQRGGAAGEDLRQAQRAVELDLRNPIYAFEYARALAAYGAPPAAVDAAYAETFRRFPAYPLAHAEYAAYLARTGRDDAAREQVRIAGLVHDSDDARIAAIEAAELLLAQHTP